MTTLIAIITLPTHVSVITLNFILTWVVRVSMEIRVVILTLRSKKICRPIFTGLSDFGMSYLGSHSHCNRGHI